MACPACGCAGLKPHARYSKYHRDRLIDIARVICTGCGITHALIPSFSLPDSSHDTGDVEKYLAARELGQTRRKAGICQHRLRHGNGNQADLLIGR